jgi:hypothetical protein
MHVLGAHAFSTGRMTVFTPQNCDMSQSKGQFTGYLQAANCTYPDGCPITTNRAHTFGPEFNKSK